MAALFRMLNTPESRSLHDDMVVALLKSTPDKPFTSDDIKERLEIEQGRIDFCSRMDDMRMANTLASLPGGSSNRKRKKGGRRANLQTS